MRRSQKPKCERFCYTKWSVHENDTDPWKTEFHRAENRRSGSFHDIIFDCQKRGVVKDDFDIIKALTNIDSEMCSNRLSTESGVYNQIGAEPLTVMPTITDEFDEVGDNLLDLRKSLKLSAAIILLFKVIQ